MKKEKINGNIGGIKMDLLKMLAAQKQLDTYIIKMKGLEGIDLVQNTVVALDIELSEMANEKRWFKHWSNNRLKPKDGLLDEIADCLHFYFSLAIQMEWIDQLVCANQNKDVITLDNASEVFLSIKRSLLDAFDTTNDFVSEYYKESFSINFSDSFVLFMKFATKFCGYSYENLEDAYFKKHAINISRQKEGY